MYSPKQEETMPVHRQLILYGLVTALVLGVVTTVTVHYFFSTIIKPRKRKKK